MKKFLIWFFAFIITIGAAYYQRKTGPTYPKRVQVTINGNLTGLKLVRSLGLNERSEVKLGIKDTSIKAVLYFKRYRSDEEYSASHFTYKVYPLKSFVMNKVFKMTEEAGFFAEMPQQPAAGKLQYYIEITDSEGVQKILKETPVVVRYKGTVPGYILGPHILIMFIAMLFSTAAGLLAVVKVPSYRKYGIWTLILLGAGGIILGPIVQKFAFGELWTGVPVGWDLTDNKTLIAFLLWGLAVYLNYKKERPLYTILAAIGLLLVYSIPHSLFGSEFDYAAGEVTQGIIFIFFIISRKNS
jgi:hypothetical protein